MNRLEYMYLTSFVTRTRRLVKNVKNCFQEISIKCDEIDSKAISFFLVKSKVSYLFYVLCKSEDFNTSSLFTMSV